MAAITKKSKRYNDFTKFGLDARLLKAVLAMKFVTPTEIQKEAIPIALERQDIMMKSKTGSGKTLAFCLPLLQQVLIRKASLRPSERDLGPKALILAPTQELIFQIGNVINNLLKYADDALSGLALIQQGLLGMQSEKPRLAEGPDIVICTPSRLAAHLEAHNVSLQYVQHVVVDEADLLMATDYEDDIKIIVNALECCSRRPQMVMCSATLNMNTANVQHWFLMHRPQMIDLGGHEALAEQCQESKLTEYILKVPYKKDKFLAMFGLLRLEIVTGKVIIFTYSLDLGYRLKLFLERFLIRTAVLNPMLPVKSRQDIISKFNKGIITHLITTDSIDAHDDRSNIMNYWVQPTESSNFVDSNHPSSAESANAAAHSSRTVKSERFQDEVSSVGGHSGYASTNPFDSGSMKAPSTTRSDGARSDVESVGGESVGTIGTMKSENGGDVTESEWDFEDHGDDLMTEKSGQTTDANKVFDQVFSREELEDLETLEVTGKVAYRGVDFREVAAVINFTSPHTEERYIHRAGRTARGGNYGICITLCSRNEWEAWFRERVYDRRVRRDALGRAKGPVIQALPLTMKDLEPFQYRCDSVRQQITKQLIKLARLNELRMEILNAKRLQSQFSDRKREFEIQKHDAFLRPSEMIKPHLSSIPSYMLVGTILRQQKAQRYVM